MDTLSTVGGWDGPARHTMAPERPTGTLTIPLPLTHDLADVPQAIGVYALVARLYAIYQRPIPLSAQDLHSYDPQLTYGRARRALQRLVRSGWLAQQHTPGQKASYLPTWGQGRAWDTTAPRAWGRPRRLMTLPLAARLLDTCIGKLTPHAQQPARCSRYLTSPSLSLDDLGAYLLTLAGVPTPTSALLRLGLVDTRQARPLPTAEALLCLASQPQPATAAPQLTTAGIKRLGVTCTTPEDPDPRQPLFFVPPDLVGSMTAAPAANQDGFASPRSTPFMAQECHESALPAAGQRAPWKQAIQAKKPTTSGGGALVGQGADQAAPSAPRTPAPLDQRLLALGVRPRQCVAFQSLDPAVIGDVIAYAERCAGIENLPGLVVSLLRDAQTSGWRPPASASPFVSDTAKYTTGAYAGCFQIHRPEPVAALLPAVPASQPPLPAPGVAAPSALAVLPPVPPASTPQPPAWQPPDNATMWRAVQHTLEQQMTRQQFADSVGVAGLLELVGSTVVVRVPTPAAHEQLGVRWRTLLARAFEAQLGYPVQIRVVLGPAG